MNSDTDPRITRAGQWIAVVHEYPMSETRTDYSLASSLHDTIEAAENQLAYCEGMQAEGRRGSDGRYFIARVTEHQPGDPS